MTFSVELQPRGSWKSMIKNKPSVMLNRIPHLYLGRPLYNNNNDDDDDDDDDDDNDNDNNNDNDNDDDSNKLLLILRPETKHKTQGRWTINHQYIRICAGCPPLTLQKQVDYDYLKPLKALA